MPGEVDDHGDRLVIRTAPANERDDVARGVIRVDPVETAWVAIATPQRRPLLVGAVEIAYERLDAAMVGMVEQPPVQAAALRPLRLLRELPAHEQKLTPGVAPLVCEQGTHSRELAPTVA